MKIAVLLLLLGLVIGLVMPYYMREIYSGAGIQLGSKSFNFDLMMVLRVVGILFGVLAII
jgi:hypothetical protein